MTKIILFEERVPDGYDKLVKKFGVRGDNYIDEFAKNRFSKELIEHLEGLDALTEDDYDDYELRSKCKSNPDTIFAFEYEDEDGEPCRDYIGWNSDISNFVIFHIKEYDETVKHQLFECDGADVLEPLGEPVCFDKEHNIWGFKVDDDPHYNPLGH